MADISQIKVGTITYDIKDTWARNHLSNPMSFVGKTTTPLTDGATTNPITVDGESYTAVKGDVVLSGDNQEFVFDGTYWELLGDEGSYVVKGTYTVSGTIGDYTYQPAGTVSTPSFTGTTATVTVSGTISATDLPVSETTVTSVTATSFSGTPAGTVSTPTFTGDTLNISASGLYDKLDTIYAPGVTTKTFTGTTATISVETTDAVTSIGAHTYQPEGTVVGNLGVGTTGHSFTGTTATITASTSYQPAGTVSKPNVSVSSTTDTFVKTASGTFVTGVSGGVGTSSYVGSVSGEVLDLGSAISTVSAISAPTGTVSVTSDTVVVGVSAALAAAPEFTGTTATITATGSYQPAGDVTGSHIFTGTTATISHNLFYNTITMSTSYQPAGTLNVVIASPTFSTTATGVAVTGSATPSGTISQPTFTGDTLTISKRLIAKLAQTSISASGSYQPAGSVSQPTFTGTTATHSHSYTGSVVLQ